jgi:hypothetical protein
MTAGFVAISPPSGPQLATDMPDFFRKVCICEEVGRNMGGFKALVGTWQAFAWVGKRLQYVRF